MIQPVNLFLLIILLTITSNATQSWNEWQPGWSKSFSDFLDAIYTGNVTATRSFIDNGIAVNFKMDGDCTPLKLAAISGNDTITFMLLEHGARISPGELAQYAAATASLPVLQYINNRISLKTVGHNTLCHAFECGAPDTIVSLLIANASLSTRDDPCFTSLLTNNNHYSERDKKRYCVLMLNAGLHPSEQSATIQLVQFAQKQSDSTLNRLVKPFLRKEKMMSPEELNTELLRDHTVKEFDSLLDIGADPMGRTNYNGCSAGKRNVSSAFEHLRGMGCASSDRINVNYFRLLGHLVERDKSRYEKELTDRDRIFIAVVTGNHDLIRRYIKNRKEDIILKQAARNHHRTLAIAAEVGDSSMCTLLCSLAFDRNEHIYALEFAVKAGNSDIVRIIVNSMIEKKFPFMQDKEFVPLFNIMIYDRKRTQKNDITISRTMLEMVDTAHHKFRLPVEELIVQGINKNPVLAWYLLQMYKEPLDATAFYKVAGRNPEIFLDSEVMNKVPVVCTKIIDAILPSSKEYTSDDLESDFSQLKKKLFILNTLCAKDFPFDSAVKDGWVGYVGSLLVGYDRIKHRFVPRWPIQSIFSNFGKFDESLQGFGWRCDEIIPSDWKNRN
jgi:ankyrin repeat protein